MRSLTDPREDLHYANETCDESFAAIFGSTSIR